MLIWVRCNAFRDDQVAAVNLCDPSPYIVASIDHAMHLTRQLDVPMRVHDSTTADADVPYPLLVLAGPAHACKTQLRSRLIGMTDSPFHKWCDAMP